MFVFSAGTTKIPTIKKRQHLHQHQMSVKMRTMEVAVEAARNP